MSTDTRSPATQAAEQLGLQGLAIPEEFGGSGYGYVELGIVLEEMGRSLLCAPFFSTVVLAANTLLQSGDDGAKKDYLPGIASGAVLPPRRTSTWRPPAPVPVWSGVRIDRALVELRG